MDDRFSGANRQSTWTALGTAVHNLYEALYRGAFDGLDGQDVRTAAATEWDRLVAVAAEELKAESTGPAPPPPMRWPRYQLTRVKLVNAVSEAARRRASLREGDSKPKEGTVSVEEWTRTRDGLLVGRIDRVERFQGHLELVDIKNGVTWPEPSLGPDSSYGRQLLLYAFIWHDQHGEWPTTVSLQRTDGSRVSATLDTAMAEAQGAEAYRLLEAFNEAVQSPSESALAEPSVDTCSYCPFRGACNPFLEETGTAWDMFRATVRGTVLGVEETNRGQRLTLSLTEGTVPTGQLWRLAPVPEDHGLRAGAVVSVSDALYTKASNDLRIEWDSVLWVWP